MRFRFKAACVAVGSELLGSAKLDRNSLEITRVLETYGFKVIEKRVVGDRVESIAAAIRDLMAQCELVVLTGGLGPTSDDVTRQAVADALDRRLRRDPEIEDWLEKRYREMGREMPEICRVMADVVEGTRILRNSRGSAPGLLAEDQGRLLVVFPGVPFEMREMLEVHLKPELQKRSEGRHRISRTLLLGGVVESETEARIRQLYDGFGREDITILASFGVLRLILAAEGESGFCTRRLDEMEGAFREILGEDIAGVDVDSLAEVVVSELGRLSLSLATAESCTGGMVGEKLTSISGASGVYAGGVVSYSNEAKENLLGVPREMLEAHGAVSAEVACAMAEGVRNRLQTDWGLGVTGIAGPLGGTEEKPVGLVHWAVAGPDGCVEKHRVLPGDRDVIRQWSTNAVLDLLRRRIG